MDFIGGALPNVMFLIGVIAIGIGLGLEFKIIEVKNGLSRGGRIGAGVIGVALVATSIALYLRPVQTASSPAPDLAAATNTTGGAEQAPASLASTPNQTAPTDAPSATPTNAPTAAPTVEVPDIRGMSAKEAERQLAQVGLQLGEAQPSCEELGVSGDLVVETRKGRITCQSAAPGSGVAKGSVVSYVLSDKTKD